MNHQELVQQLRDATAHTPPDARDRVWRRLRTTERPAAQRWPWLAGAAFATAAVLAFVLVPRAPKVMPLVAIGGEGFVTVAPAGALTRQGSALELRTGEVLVSSWGGQVELVAGGHHVKSDAAVFALRAAPDFALTVEEGAVLLDGERIAAPRRAATPPDFGPLRATEPSEASIERAWVLAENAAAEGRIEEAIERFAALAKLSSLRAEAALLRKAQLELWSQHRPELALSTLTTATERFPSGALRQEIAFSELEAYVAQEKWPAAVAKASAFVDAFPDSERKAEVEQVRAAAQARLKEF